GTDNITVSYTAGPDNAIETNAVNFWTNEPLLPPGVNFNDGLPADWTIIDGGSTPDTWMWSAGYGYSGSTLDGTPFMIVDSDEAGSGGILMQETLLSPVVDLSGATSLTLEFDQYYNNLSSSEFADVDVWDGTQWVNVLHMNSDFGSWGSPDHQVIDVSAYANSDFQVRFYYDDNAGWYWYWAIDNVAVYVDSRSLTGGPPSYNIPVTAYVVEPFDSLDTDSGYRGLNSILPGGARVTDYPEFGWIDNISPENAWTIADGNIFLAESIDYFGQAVSEIEIYNDGTHFWPILVMNPESIRKSHLPQIDNSYVYEVGKDMKRDADSPIQRADIPLDNSIWASNWATGTLYEVYVSNEEFGLVITADMPGFLVCQIIIYNSGDVKIQYLDFSTTSRFFLDLDGSWLPNNYSIIGVRGMGEENQIPYDKLDWVYTNLKPGIAVQFYPQYDDTALLPSPITWNEDNVYYMNVAELIPTGGEILTIIMTDSDHISTVVDGNNIEF
ncbi:MAG: hypothetical protein KAT74_06010, partial [Candidatus Cloacimonetes bacterium]|nr:hypothetical protein [Candidatus Cloacimonadota bacterium]